MTRFELQPQRPRAEEAPAMQTGTRDLNALDCVCPVLSSSGLISFPAPLEVFPVRSGFASSRFREVDSKNLLPYAHEEEKVETPVIDIEALRAISRILRPIKERIGTEDGADRGNCTAGDQCATATGANCSQNNHSEKGEKR